MPIKDKHIEQAQHNRDFWRSLGLSSTPYPDWVVTGIFYEGVHWVEAFLETRGYHSDNHRTRLATMRMLTEICTITIDLETLKQDSENARYMCYKHSAADISNDLVPIVDKIKHHIQGLL